MAPRPATVIVVSDRSAAGVREDASGPAAAARLLEAGFRPVQVTVVPDGGAPGEGALRTALAPGARLGLTSGGTGGGPRDRAPQGARARLDPQRPGLPGAP